MKIYKEKRDYVVWLDHNQQINLDLLKDLNNTI